MNAFSQNRCYLAHHVQAASTGIGAVTLVVDPTLSLRAVIWEGDQHVSRERVSGHWIRAGCAGRAGAISHHFRDQLLYITRARDSTAAPARDRNPVAGDGRSPFGSFSLPDDAVGCSHCKILGTPVGCSHCEKILGTR